MIIQSHKRRFLQSNHGTSPVLDFEDVFRQTKHMAELMDRADLLPTAQAVGTSEGYQQYRRALLRFTNHPASASTYFDPSTAAAVANLLERARLRRTRIRLFYGDPASGIDALAMRDLIGRVDRQAGPIKRPLLVTGGDAVGPTIPTTRILRILDLTNGTELYRHGRYQLPQLMIAPSGYREHPFVVVHRRCQLAAFATEEQAQEWIEFMHGVRAELFHSHGLRLAA